ncbi:MAG: type VI secretion system needle protein Hcp [Bacteroidetes bacterium]|nr:type VI secretion system needle protein Hcp [Bacteroidota bacterium]MBS1739940.1 type VI secretion system needle protein Hcp [Bacteroidota bacterium]
MASFKATAKIGSVEFKDVIECSYSLHRDVAATGQPSSQIYGGKIDLVVESSDNTGIIESMVNQYKPIDGTITFKKSDEDAKMKELSFTKGHVVFFEENFSKDGNNPMFMKFTVSAEKIKIGNAEHENTWKNV